MKQFLAFLVALGFYLATCVLAQDEEFVGPPAPTPVPASNEPLQVQQTVKAVETTVMTLEALNAWLYDLEALEAGEAPEGFVLPAMDEYRADPVPRCPRARQRLEADKVKIKEQIKSTSEKN